MAQWVADFPWSMPDLCSAYVTTLWINCLLWVSQPGQLSFPSLWKWVVICWLRPGDQGRYSRRTTYRPQSKPAPKDLWPKSHMQPWYDVWWPCPHNPCNYMDMDYYLFAVHKLNIFCCYHIVISTRISAWNILYMWTKTFPLVIGLEQ